MSEAEISISSPDPWKQRYGAFPLGLVEACLWLAAVYAFPTGLNELLKMTNFVMPPEVPSLTPQVIVMTLIAVVFIFYWRLGRKATLGALGISTANFGRELGFTAIVAAALGLFYAAVIGAIYLGCFWFAPDGVESFRGFARGSGFGDTSAGYIFAVVVALPVLEEFWFRGMMYTPMRREFGKWPAIVMLATIFAAMHYPAVQVPINQFFGGLVFAWVYERRRTLAAPVLLHIAANGSLAIVTQLAEQWGLR